jgi:hypothetical protein
MKEMEREVDQTTKQKEREMDLENGGAGQDKQLKIDLKKNQEILQGMEQSRE